MSSSDNQRHGIKALPAFAITLITLGLLLGVGAVAWAQDGIDVSPDGGVTLRDGDELIQVDEACVLIRNGERDLSVGDRCPDDKPQDTGTSEAKDTKQPAPDKAQDEDQQPGGTTGSGQTVPETTMETTTETMTGSTTGPDEPASTTPEDGSELQPVTVERAVDGDTLQISPQVEGTDTVRLIGLDTPELATDEAPIPEPLAEEAATFTAESLEGKEILLQLDEDLKDDYGRLLAYAWIEDPAENDKAATAEEPGSLFNETLLRQGYAKIFTVEPNVLYLDRLEAAEAAAEEEGIGVWDLEAGRDSTTPSTQQDTTPTTGPLPETDRTGTGDQYSKDPAKEKTSLEETPQEPFETTGQKDYPTMMGTTLETSDAPDNQGLRGGTTVTNDPNGGATMEDPGGTTMESTGSTETQAFDPENLKREATRLAQESLQPEEPPAADPDAEPDAEPGSGNEEPQDLPSSSPDVGSPPAPSASEEVPVSQSSEPPVQILPETGGPALMIVFALLFVAGGTIMLGYHHHATGLPNRTPSDANEDRRGE